ncbi:MAG: Holliday junction resolvase RuvX [Chloroflexota bacterium]
MPTMETQRILALDWGEKRIGVAFSEGILASPHSVIRRKSRVEDYRRVATLVSDLKIELVVLGLPKSLNPDMPLGPQAKRVLKYQQELQAHIDVPIALVDEQYSTVNATELLDQTSGQVSGRRSSGRKKKTPIDAAAAAVILQRYLDGKGQK